MTLAATAQGKAVAQSVELQPSVTVQGSHVLLRDIAVPGAGADDAFHPLAQIVVAPAPPVGEHRLITRAELHAVLGPAWRINGAAATTVNRSGQPLAAERLCAAAVSAAEQKLSGLGTSFRHQIECKDKAPLWLTLPEGAVNIRADLASWQPQDGVQRLPVDLIVGGRIQRRLGIAVDIHLQAVQWCARGPLAGGEILSPSRVALCWAPVRHLEHLIAAGSESPVGRLRRLVHDGEPLRADDLMPPSGVLAGDMVTVHYREGAVELEAAGKIEQEARVGDMVLVQLGAAPQPVVGRLVAQRIVELEAHP